MTVLVTMSYVCAFEMSSSEEQVLKINSDLMKKSDQIKRGPQHLADNPWTRPWDVCVALFITLIQWTPLNIITSSQIDSIKRIIHLCGAF